MKYFLLLFLFIIVNGVFATGKKKSKSTAKTTTVANTANTTSTFNASAYRNAVKGKALENSRVENIEATTIVYTKPKGDEFIQLIGKNLLDNAVQHTLNAFDRDFVVVNMANAQAYILKNSGLVFIFDHANNLNQINFYLKGTFQNIDMSNYLDKLPLDLEFGISKPDVDNLFGKPSETLFPANSETIFCNYILNNKGIVLSTTYNEYINTTIDPKLLELTISKLDQPLSVATSSVSEAISISTTPKPEITHTDDNMLKAGNWISTDMVRLLGLSIYDFKINQLMESLGQPDEVIPGINKDSKYIYKSNGLILQFDNLNRLLGFFVINQPSFMDMSFNAYNGKVPFDISFLDNKYTVEKKVGKATDNNLTDIDNLWTKHSIIEDSKAYNVIINYKNKGGNSATAVVSDLYVSLKRN